MKHIIISLAILLCFQFELEAQSLGGIFTRFETDLREWIIIDEEGSEIGFLKMRWMIQNDLTLWDYQLGDSKGEIRARWRDRLTEWEVHSEGSIYTLRQIWDDVPTEWRMTDDQGLDLTFLTRWANTPEDWELREKSEYGRFEQFTAWEGDPREWVIIDQLSPKAPSGVRMGLVFLPILTAIR
jgi:hypothetical protein